MKRIGVISLNINTDDLNYGALLHSYAFQQFLSRYNGIYSEIIDYKGPSIEVQNLKYPTLSLLIKKKYYVAMMSVLRFFSHAKRYEKFKTFIEEYCIISNTSYNQKALDEDELDYDIVVCESDVIWSPNITQPGFDKAFFLASESMKKKRRVAYAASLANALFSAEQEKEFISLLSNVESISCRESYAAEYVHQLVGRDVACVLDPVLLLKDEDYSKFIKERIIDEPYILLYLPIEYNRTTVKKVRRYAKEKGLRIIEVSSYPFDMIHHKVIRDAGIEEFLSLIKNAEIVISNSFHAVCFSVIFKKEFYAFTRKTGRKIEDICTRLGLEDRFVKNELIERPAIDYDEINLRLERYREESINYIEKKIIYC